MKLLAAAMAVAALALYVAWRNRQLRALPEWDGGPGAYANDGTWVDGWWPCSYCGEGHIDRKAAEPGGRCYWRRLDLTRDYPAILPV